jgi:hypothetical protein
MKRIYREPPSEATKQKMSLKKQGSPTLTMAYQEMRLPSRLFLTN